MPVPTPILTPIILSRWAPLLWILKKILENLPAVIVPQVLALLNQVMDPETPAWKRAAIAAVLIELVALVNATVPVSVICRFLVLNAAFGQQAAVLRREDDKPQIPQS